MWTSSFPVGKLMLFNVSAVERNPKNEFITDCVSATSSMLLVVQIPLPFVCTFYRG